MFGFVVLVAVPWLLTSVYVSAIVLPVHFCFRRVHFLQWFILCKQLTCGSNRETRRDKTTQAVEGKVKGMAASTSMGHYKLVAFHALQQEKENMALHKFCVTDFFAKVLL